MSKIRIKFLTHGEFVAQGGDVDVPEKPAFLP